MSRIVNDVCDPGLHISRVMLEAICECAQPTAVALYLRAYPDIAAKIARGSSLRQTIEIRKIDGALEQLDEAVVPGIREWAEWLE